MVILKLIFYEHALSRAHCTLICSPFAPKDKCVRPFKNAVPSGLSKKNVVPFACSSHWMMLKDWPDRLARVTATLALVLNPPFRSTINAAGPFNVNSS